ncbi:MAG: nucleotide exchange factor GrpE [Myxococcus sp.]|nr:nucleotide exchange factor GrpE [Myxococcus sp.]
MSDPSNQRESEPPEVAVRVNDRRRVREDGVEAGEPEVTEVARLTADLEAARRRIDELARGLQHSEAEREAFKHRMTRERDQLLELEKGKVAVVLLESIDDLDLCLRSADDSPFSKGVKLIRDGLIKRAEEFGLERVELLGLPFDPNLSEASDMELTDDQASDGRVVEVLKAAWRLKSRVLRPGRVKVARYVAPAQA